MTCLTIYLRFSLLVSRLFSLLYLTNSSICKFNLLNLLSSFLEFASLEIRVNFICSCVLAQPGCGREWRLKSTVHHLRVRPFIGHWSFIASRNPHYSTVGGLLIPHRRLIELFSLGLVGLLCQYAGGSFQTLTLIMA